MPAVGARGPQTSSNHTRNKPSPEHTQHPRIIPDTRVLKPRGSVPCGQCYIHRRPHDRPTDATFGTHTSGLSSLPYQVLAMQEGPPRGFCTHAQCVCCPTPASITVDKGSTPPHEDRPLPQNAHRAHMAGRRPSDLTQSIGPAHPAITCGPRAAARRSCLAGCDNAARGLSQGQCCHESLLRKPMGARPPQPHPSG